MDHQTAELESVINVRVVVLQVRFLEHLESLNLSFDRES